MVEGHGGFCFQGKDYDLFQEKWYCCGESCYYFSKEEKTWERSKESCEDLRSSLIKLDNKEEQVCLLY